MTKADTTYTVLARRWAEGWELHIDGVGVTQSKTLAKAAGVARDYISTVFDLDEPSEVKVKVAVRVSDVLDARVSRLSALKSEAVRQQEEAARESRETARALVEFGLSTTDAADVLGVSKGRVSQLIGKSAGA